MSHTSTVVERGAENVDPPTLTEAELRSFRENGFVGPYTLCPPGEMAARRRRLASVLARRGRPARTKGETLTVADELRPRQIMNSHLDSADVYELASRPAVVDRIAALLGPDLLLWRTVFWNKPPGTFAVPWHQDLYRDEGIGEISNISCWIAIEDVTEASGCVELVRGSSRLTEKDFVFGADYQAGLAAGGPLEPPTNVAAGDVVKMVLKAGQFFIFDQLTLHGSGPNRTANTRIGLALRFMPPGAEAKLDVPCILVRGKDVYGRQKLVAPPARGAAALVQKARRRLGRLVRSLHA